MVSKRHYYRGKKRAFYWIMLWDTQFIERNRPVAYSLTLLKSCKKETGSSANRRILLAQRMQFYNEIVIIARIILPISEYILCFLLIVPNEWITNFLCWGNY